MVEPGGSEIAAELAMESVGDGADERVRWHQKVAFTTLALAALVAVSALLSGVTSHELLITRTEEIVDFTLFEGDRTAAAILHSEHEILRALGQEPDPEEVAEVEAILAEAEELREEAIRLEEESVRTSRSHLMFSIAATIGAVAIAVTGLAVIVNRRWLWYVGSAIGAAGFVLLLIEMFVYFL